VVAELNSHLLRGVTPPRDSSWVRIPTGRALGFAERYAALSAEDRDAFRRLETRKNETRATLARRAGITVRQLGWYNPELKASKRGKLVAGQRVLVPTALTLATALDIPDPAIERYGSSTARKRGEPVLHVVRRGESLGGIAKKYGTSVAALKRMNHLRKSVIFPGQEIMVREGGGSSRSRSASRSTSSSTRRVASSQRESSAKPSSSRRVSLSTAGRMDSGRKSSNGAARTHVVKRGESLTSIARKYGTTVTAIKELNGLERDAIQAGKRLKVGG
jgi:LysM repeat protein